MKPLRILIWHVHGSYLYYLTSRSQHDFYLPSKPDRKSDYSGKWGHLPWGENVHDVPINEVKNLDLDAVIFQLPSEYLNDQYDILSPAQRRLPKIYLEHEAPQEKPADSVHFIDDPNTLIVHVTPFNKLMWNTRRTPSIVIEHGVMVPESARYTGEFDRGLVVINHLAERGRRLGADVYLEAAKQLPLDLVGLESEKLLNGRGEILHGQLPDFEKRYRFLFTPIRYGSLALGVVEAMMIGLPVVGLATTEMATVIENGVSGYVDTRVENLVTGMKILLKDTALAFEMGQQARRTAEKRFHINRFTSDWDNALDLVCGRSSTRSLVEVEA